MLPKIIILILNWNREKDTTECLNSLAKITYKNYSIIVIDNGSKDGSGAVLKKKFPNIKFIQNYENVGFAEGNNVGIRMALNKNCDYVLLLNNDTIVDSKFLDELVKFSEQNENTGAVSPKIYYYNKPNIIWFAGGVISKLSGRTFHIGINLLDEGQYNNPKEVDFLTGCAFLVKRKVIEDVGLLDSDYFNNFEDVDWSIRIRKRGYSLLYVPSAKIWHKWSVSFGGRFSPLNTYYKVRNSLLYLKKNRMPHINFIYAYSIFPIKMIFYTLMSFDLKNIKAGFTALKDYFAGNYGIGSANKLK